jgi:outer membrane protein assembly factor BamB
LIDGNTVIIGVGGKLSLIGVDIATGSVLWETPNADNWKMSHTSILPIVFNNKKMFVYVMSGGVIAVDEKGKLLWKTIDFNHQIIVPSPIDCGNGSIFLTAGYGAGSMMIKIYQDGNDYKVKKVFEYKPDQGLASEQQSPIFYKDHIISINPDDGGVYKNQLVCSDLKGKIIWSSGNENRFGLGPYMIINDKIVLLTDDGELYLIQASIDKFRLIGKKKILDGVEAWAPLCYVNGILLARDSKKMVCYKFGN